MSPQNRSGEISLYQRPPYLIRLQTVWRLYGGGVETHSFSVPADGDQDDLITWEGWTPRNGNLTLNTATALISTDCLTCGNAALRESGVASLGPPDVQIRAHPRPSAVAGLSVKVSGIHHGG
jgi:hypothetical protein